MGAAKGNKYYLNRIKSGREKKYKPDELIEKACKYFEWCDNNPKTRKELLKGGTRAGEIVEIPLDRPYTAEGLCTYLEISRKTFENYEKDKEFIPFTTRIRDIIRQNQLEGAIVGNFAPNIIARLLGLKENTEATINGGLSINVVSSETKKDLEKLKETLNKK